MKRIFAVFCILLGIALIFGAAGLMCHNFNEEAEAQKNAEEYLPKVMDFIAGMSPSEDELQSVSEPEAAAPSESPDTAFLDNTSVVGEMLVAEIDGYGFIGYISIPALGIRLPVLSETDMALMRYAPCRFSGSPKTGDLVVGAHNYSTHFGSISELTEGDAVLFVDMEGVVWQYSAAFTEILSPDDVDSLTDGEFPLTLYTCTYDGSHRIAVRCK